MLPSSHANECKECHNRRDQLAFGQVPTMAEVTMRQQQDDEEVHILPQLKQPHMSSEKHKTLRLTHRRSVQPQDGNDDVNALPNHVKSKRNSVPVVRPTNRTLLPTLEAIEAITKAIQDELAALEDLDQQQGEEDDVTSSRDEATRDLADLYCERARLLVEYTKYDTSVPLTEAFMLVDDGQEQDDVAKDVSAMQQALTDAVTAISMDVELIIGYDLAARCARALGRIKYAINLTNLGLRVEAGNANLLQLKKELEVDTDTMRFTFAPPLLYRMETESNEVSGLQQAPSDMLQATTTTIPAEDFQARYHAMKVLSGSVMLRKMEQMMHHNIHHQCAKVDEVKALEAAFNQTMGFLAALLLDSTTTSRATNIEAITLENIGKQLTKPSVLVESNYLRRWIVKTLTPAVTKGLLCNDPMCNAPESRTSLLRDVLLVITRLSLAVGNLHRCTRMPHVLSYVKVAFDLAKQFAGEKASSSSLPSQQSRSQSVVSCLVRLEMVCTDAYAVALLDLTEESSEALLLHQESLELAVHKKDANRELCCHHFIGRVLLKMQEIGAAETEFSQLLQQSRALGDKSMECLAWYELGECCIARRDLTAAMTNFENALEICNATAHCQSTWRLHSVKHAMELYASMRRSRRYGMTALSSQLSGRSDSFLRRRSTAIAVPNHDSIVWLGHQHLAQNACLQDSASKIEEAHQPRRRQAIWSKSPDLESPQSKQPSANRSLLDTLFGDFEENERQVITDEPASPVLLERISGISELRKTQEPALWHERDAVVSPATQATSTNGEGPLSTHNLSLVAWLFGPELAAGTNPTQPACLKPIA